MFISILVSKNRLETMFWVKAIYLGYDPRGHCEGMGKPDKEGKEAGKTSDDNFEHLGLSFS